MTLVVPSVSTVNGQSMNTLVGNLPRLVTRVVRGWVEHWEVRGQDTVIPGSAGRVARSRVRDVLPIELEVIVMAAPAGYDDLASELEDMETAELWLRSLMDPTQAPVSIVVATADGGTRSINARPVNIMADDGANPALRRFSLLFEAVGSDWA